MRTALALLLALTILASGCAVLGDKRVAAGCQLADGFTTYHALNAGAVERNPLLEKASPQGILALKALVAWAIMKFLPDREHATSGDRFMIGVASVLGCAPAINNYNVYRDVKGK